jgi:hypothetical protein
MNKTIPLPGFAPEKVTTVAHLLLAEAISVDNGQNSSAEGIIADAAGSKSSAILQKISQSSESEFLSLFPHRHDFLFADFPNPGESPNWQTESRFPLSDRKILQGGKLHGVRFGTHTDYLLLDIDFSSRYHLKQDRLAIEGIKGALEEIGLVDYVLIQSSDSGGIHLFIPISESQPSWEISLLVTLRLKAAGYLIAPGHLEIFPNPRGYSDELSLYNGHRLPLQQGSYLLNKDFESIFSTQEEFVKRWKFAQQNNTITNRQIKAQIKKLNRNSYYPSKKASDFRNDLEAVINLGWTGRGQTNELLGKIALKAYIFDGLEGTPLAMAIADTARSLPGYDEYCQHQSEIDRKSRYWARSVERDPKYYPYQEKPKGSTLLEATASKPNQNDLRAEDSQKRIKTAKADLIAKGELPDQITAREKAIAAFGISTHTLQKYKKIWHPKYDEVIDHTSEKALEIDLDQESPESLSDIDQYTLAPNKLVSAIAAPQSAGNLDNSLAQGGSGGDSGSAPCPPEVSRKIRETLNRTNQANREREQANLQRQVSESSPEKTQKISRIRSEKERLRLKHWLASGDPLLVSEALKQLGGHDRINHPQTFLPP